MKNLFAFFLIFLAAKVYSQVDTLDFINEKLFQLIEDAAEDQEDLQYYDIIEELMQNPIDINNADINQLSIIPFLTTEDADKIIKERKKRKGFRSVRELNTIKNLHPDLIILLTPFLYVSEIEKSESKKRININELKIQFRTRFLSDVQEREGFRNGNFNGNRLKSYNRIKIDFNQLRFGLLTEKDAGELSYYDHYTGFLEYKSSGIIQKLIIGDYNYEFGQGLVLWSPYSFSKGMDAVGSPTKRDRKFTPHLSSEENVFFRGGAISLYYNSISLSGFYSNHNIDASINDYSEVNNFYLAGYHRTESEKSKKNVINEKAYGVSLKYAYNSTIEVGLLHYIDKFSKPFSYVNNTKLSGNSFSFSSLSYRLHLKKTSINGELSYNGNAFAIVGNLFIPITNHLEVLSSYRNYSPQYFNIYANGFGEYGNTQNEIGYYLGTKIRTEIGTFNFYYDIFKSPSQSFKSNFPASGTDFLFNYNGRILENTVLVLKIKYENKEVSLADILVKKVRREVKSNYRIDLKYKINHSLNAKTRIEVVNYLINGQSENGFLTYQELKYQIRNRLSLTGRIIFFETESYNSRLYEFENDLRGLMTNIPMFGEGLRFYLLINYTLFEALNINFKYSETFKSSIKSISSGNSKILGNVDNRLSFQIDYTF